MQNEVTNERRHPDTTPPSNLAGVVVLLNAVAVIAMVLAIVQVPQEVDTTLVNYKVQGWGLYKLNPV
jgi:hypothetical protein